MIKFNWLILLLSSFIPLILAYFWFNLNWSQKILNLNENSNLAIKWSVGSILGLFILSFMYSISISYQVIHQLHFQSLLLNEVGFDKGEGNAYKDLLYIFELYGKNFRSFGHGAFHGLLNSIFIVLPILVFQKLINKIDWKTIVYIWAFWAIGGILMGGIICELYY
jgi:hypothetical protein